MAEPVVDEVGDDFDDEEETLDFIGDLFDPLKALYSKKIVVPVPTAPTYDNIHVYQKKTNYGVEQRTEALLKREEIFRQAKQDAEDRERLEKLLEKRRIDYENFEPPSRDMEGSSLLNKMDEQAGPLRLLHKCVKERIRIKVTTRNDTTIRGHCIGYLRAFDKMWNLAMSDVTETWTRKRKKKVPAMDQLMIDSSTHKLDRPRIPEVRVVNGRRHMEVCTRHVQQLMMRGEHVVTICLLGQLPPTLAQVERTKRKDYQLIQEAESMLSK